MTTFFPGQLVMSRKMPEHFAFLLVIVDPRDVGAVPVIGSQFVQLVNPLPHLPPSYNSMHPQQQQAEYNKMAGVFLRPEADLTTPEELGLVLWSARFEQEARAAQQQVLDQNANMMVNEGTDDSSEARSEHQNATTYTLVDASGKPIENPSTPVFSLPQDPENAISGQDATPIDADRRQSLPSVADTSPNVVDTTQNGLETGDLRGELAPNEGTTATKRAKRSTKRGANDA
jgi:hypothetical protein